MKVRISATIVSTALCCVSQGYTPVLLHNEAIGPHSFAFGAGHGQQVGGTGQLGGHAILWEGTSKSAVALTPQGYTSSRANAASDGRQAGSAFSASAGQFHALLWSNSSQNYVNLHPVTGWLDSSALGMGGDQQVGAGSQEMGVSRALLWRGTAESMVVLHPPAYASSFAEATDGFQQVGSGFGRALLWTGTPESVIDLTPPGADSASAKGVANGEQVGTVDGQAALWHGSASSFVSLNPGAGFGSDARDTNGIHQVGFFRSHSGGFGGFAARWSGSAESLLNLHDFLPAQWGAVHSHADAIDEAGNIVGWIETQEGFRAVMWVVPEPGTIAALAAGIGLLLARRRRR